MTFCVRLATRRTREGAGRSSLGRASSSLSSRSSSASILSSAPERPPRDPDEGSERDGEEPRLTLSPRILRERRVEYPSRAQALCGASRTKRLGKFESRSRARAHPTWEGGREQRRSDSAFLFEGVGVSVADGIAGSHKVCGHVENPVAHHTTVYDEHSPTVSIFCHLRL